MNAEQEKALREYLQEAIVPLIEQVLINLLKNAAEAIEHAKRPLNERHVELQIVPKVIEQQEVVVFSVTDSGEGMPAEVMARVFEAFYTTKSEGMGIGLNLCRTIIESHQGLGATQ